MGPAKMRELRDAMVDDLMMPDDIDPAGPTIER